MSFEGALFQRVCLRKWLYIQDSNQCHYLNQMIFVRLVWHTSCGWRFCKYVFFIVLHFRLSSVCERIIFLFSISTEIWPFGRYQSCVFRLSHSPWFYRPTLLSPNFCASKYSALQWYLPWKDTFETSRKCSHIAAVLSSQVYWGPDNRQLKASSIKRCPLIGGTTVHYTVRFVLFQSCYSTSLILGQKQKNTKSSMSWICNVLEDILHFVDNQLSLSLTLLWLTHLQYL